MSLMGRKREFADASSSRSAFADPKPRRHASRTPGIRSRPVAQRGKVCDADIASDWMRQSPQGSLGSSHRTKGDRLQCSGC
jgi:hypothetical protein